MVYNIEIVAIVILFPMTQDFMTAMTSIGYIFMYTIEIFYVIIGFQKL